MTAHHLISKEIPAISVVQTGKDAFTMLSDHHVKHLPVTDGEGRLVGIISEEDIFNHKLYDPIGDYDFSMLRRYSVSENDHLFEIMRIMGENRLTVIPVVGEDKKFLGLISQNDLLRQFAATTSFAEPGSILVIEVPTRSYSLAEISRLIEEEGVKIMSCFVSSAPAAENIEITLKLNRQDISKVIASLERHEYEVLGTYDVHDHSSVMKERYDALMAYLEI